jgi:hypothetical protein
MDPMPDFPLGTINSIDRANAALSAAAVARKRVEAGREGRRRACYKDFFSESCFARVREEDYREMQRISNIEQEARDFRRHNDAAVRAQDRAARESASAAKEQQDRPLREKKSADQAKKVEHNQSEAAAFNAKAGERAANAAATRKREQDHLDDLAKKDAEDKAKAGERAEAVRKHDAKVQEAMVNAAEREKRAKDRKADHDAHPPPRPPSFEEPPPDTAIAK